MDTIGAALEGELGWVSLNPPEPLRITSLNRHRPLRAFGLGAEGASLYEGKTLVQPWLGTGPGLSELRASGERVWIEGQTKRVLLGEGAVDQQRLAAVCVMESEGAAWLSLDLAARNRVRVRRDQHVVCWSLNEPPLVFHSSEIEAPASAQWRVPWGQTRGPVPELVAIGGSQGRVGLWLQTEGLSEEAFLTFVGFGEPTAPFARAMRAALRAAAFQAARDEGQGLRSLLAFLRWARVPPSLPRFGNSLRKLAGLQQAALQWVSGASAKELVAFLPTGLELSGRHDLAWREVFEACLA
ncbi:MAG: hypothetical protein JKY65_28110 [Planctomycetes bacterium]|nr:hypothetical protein [Planctomycetota bacterium]